MKTVWMLLAVYDGRAAIPAEEVCRDFFPRMRPETFLQKADSGEIDLPVMRMDKSTNSARMVHLTSLALYLDAQMKEAREELERMRANGELT